MKIINLPESITVDRERIDIVMKDQ